MTYQEALRRLEEIRQDVLSRWTQGEWPGLAYEPYPCGPHPGAPVMVVGLIQRAAAEMPTAVEWLRGVFREAGIPAVHVTCIVKAESTTGRPTAEQVEAFLPYLRNEIVLVEPRVLAPMGWVAMRIISYLRADLPVFPLPEPRPGSEDPEFRQAVRELAVYLTRLR